MSLICFRECTIICLKETKLITIKKCRMDAKSFHNVLYQVLLLGQTVKRFKKATMTNLILCKVEMEKLCQREIKPIKIQVLELIKQLRKECWIIKEEKLLKRKKMDRLINITTTIIQRMNKLKNSAMTGEAMAKK